MFGEKKALPLKREPLFQKKKKVGNSSLRNSSPLKGSTEMGLHGELGYGRPNDYLRRAILALFFSQWGAKISVQGQKVRGQNSSVFGGPVRSLSANFCILNGFVCIVSSLEMPCRQKTL